MRLAYLTVANTFAVLGLLLATDRDKNTEILVLRHKVGVLERQLGGKKVRFSPADRALLAALLHRLTSIPGELTKPGSGAPARRGPGQTPRPQRVFMN